MYKKSVADAEANLKKADAAYKSIFQGVLDESKKQLKQAEDPNNKTYQNYARNYDQMVKSTKESNDRNLREWEAKYPANQLLFVKQRLVRFMEETKDIDFSAELSTVNNKKIFINPLYEKQKGYYWKMAFRAGREVVEPTRNFVQQWINEIK